MSECQRQRQRQTKKQECPHMSQYINPCRHWPLLLAQEIQLALLTRSSLLAFGV